MDDSSRTMTMSLHNILSHPSFLETMGHISQSLEVPIAVWTLIYANLSLNCTWHTETFCCCTELWSILHAEQETHPQ